MITLLMTAKILLLLLLGALCILVALRICYRAGYDHGSDDQAATHRLHRLPQMQERDALPPYHRDRVRI